MPFRWAGWQLCLGDLRGSGRRAFSRYVLPVDPSPCPDHAALLGHLRGCLPARDDLDVRLLLPLTAVGCGSRRPRRREMCAVLTSILSPR